MSYEHVKNLLCGNNNDKSEDDALRDVMAEIERNPSLLNKEYKLIYFGLGGKKKGTLLHFSCLWNKPKVVSFLLSQEDVDVSKKFEEFKNFGKKEEKKGEKYGLTAKQIAENLRHINIVTLFEQYEREQALRESAEREQVVREKAEREKREKAEREQIAKEKAVKEAAEREQVVREKAEREKREKAEREKREKAEREKAEQEKAEREKKEKNEREKAARKAAEREKLYQFLEQLGFDDTIIHKIEEYGIRQVEDFDHFGKEDWDSLALSTFQKNKIVNKIAKTHVDQGSSLSGMEEKLPSNNKFFSVDAYSLYSNVCPDYPITIERQNRREPPTARISPGPRFLNIVPSVQSDPNSVLNCLKSYAMKEQLPTDVIQEFQDKFEDFCNFDPPHPTERSFALALCWLYTTESWVYPKMNSMLRDDSSTMVGLAPYMKALMESYKHLKYDQSNFHTGVVYRRTKLTDKGLAFYKPTLQFVWSSFTSTAIDFDPTNQFGSILFVISIPEKFKEYALCLENVSVFPTEREVLLLPNIGFRVKSVEVGPTHEYPNTTHIINIVMAYVCIAI